MLYLRTFFLLVLVLTSAHAQLGVGDLYTSTKELVKGLSKDAKNLLPSVEGLFETSKQLVAGYPFEFVSSAINKFCSSALATETVLTKVTPDLQKMKFQLRANCTKESFPLLHADQMWKSPNFDPKKKVVILATGWTTTVNETDAIDVLAKAYNCRGDVNFVAVDAADFVDTLYTWSALNTEEIGDNIAIGLEQLSRLVPPERIHLIGHSLGAHIMGAAGRGFNEKTGKIIARITGLDPAKPCFNEGHVLSGLMRGDAAFIDIIHSNPGVLGKRDPLGDVDFYPAGLDPLPKGCISVTCAHARAWHYYAETVYPGNERNIMGKRCTSLTRLHEGKCPGKEVPMGFGVLPDAKGNYFMDVNSEEPFGKGSEAKRSEALQQCGACPSEGEKHESKISEVLKSFG